MNISELIAKFISGNTQANENSFIRSWKNNPENNKVLGELQTLWHISTRNKLKIIPDVNKAWAKIHQRINPLGQESKNTKRKTSKKVSAYICAAAAGLAAILIAILLPAKQHTLLNKTEQNENLVRIAEPVAKKISVNDSAMGLNQSPREK